MSTASSVTDSKAPGEAVLAAVATSSTRLPDAASILRAAGVAPAGFLGRLFGRSGKEHAWRDGNLVVPCRDGNLAVALMPAPIPWSDLEGPCATAWWWPEAEQQMRGHKYHILVALIGGSIDAIQRRVLLTHVVSAVVGDSDAVGVYWGEGTLVHEPREFVKRARSATAKDIPGTLWIDVRVEQNDDKSLRCFTTGMEPLGFREIEVQKSRLNAETLLSFIGDTACYIVNGRVQVKDGATMGRTAEERYRVRYGPSMFDRSQVMHLAMA